jgi:hypothetical protein
MKSTVVHSDDGVKTILHKTHDTVAVERVQDVSAIVEANKRAFNDASGRMNEFQHIGRIPVVVMDRWCKEDGINYLLKENMPLLVKKLHHPDNKFFKTHPGKFA